MGLSRITIILLITLLLSLCPASSREEAELNNTREKANIISPGELITGHTGMKSEYGYTGDIDLFCFDAKYPGILTVYGSIQKKFTSSQGEPSVRIDIFNADELKAGEWKDPATGKDASPIFADTSTTTRVISIEKPGRIYLKVDRYEADAYYSFKVSYQEIGRPEIKPVPNPIEEVGTNDTQEKAMSLPLRQPVVGHTGNISKYGIDGKRNFYLVEVPSPGKLTVYLTIEGKYAESEKGNPSLKVSVVNADEMTSGPWKDAATGKDEYPIFCKGTNGRSVFIKCSGKILLLVDRYEANAKYKMIVLFQGGE